MAEISQINFRTYDDEKWRLENYLDGYMTFRPEESTVRKKLKEYEDLGQFVTIVLW